MKTYYLKEFKENLETTLKLKKAINEKIYDKESGLYYNFDVRNNKLIKIKTIHCISPLIIVVFQIRVFRPVHQSG